MLGMSSPELCISPGCTHSGFLWSSVTLCVFPESKHPVGSNGNPGLSVVCDQQAASMQGELMRSCLPCGEPC